MVSWRACAAPAVARRRAAVSYDDTRPARRGHGYDSGSARRPARREGRQEVALTKGRLEAFSDGVIAIIITIMVLELKAPHGAGWDALRPLLPSFLSYVLSFVFLGIYWNNHHHLLQAVHRVDGRILWANLHLLFWLSLTPFVTAWMGENAFASRPVALYGVVLLCSACAYYILTRALIAQHGSDSRLARALGDDFKGKLSVVLYCIAIPLAYAAESLACAVYVAVAIMWLVPDRRLERALSRSEPAGSHEAG
jgi:uncharacterized membrane protein